MNKYKRWSVAKNPVFSLLIVFPVQAETPHVRLQPGRKLNTRRAQHLVQVSVEDCRSFGEFADSLSILNHQEGKVLGIMSRGSIPGNIDQFLQHLSGNFFSGIGPAASSGPEKSADLLRRQIEIWGEVDKFFLIQIDMVDGFRRAHRQAMAAEGAVLFVFYPNLPLFEKKNRGANYAAIPADNTCCGINPNLSHVFPSLI
jgi:hypothetical protein